MELEGLVGRYGARHAVGPVSGTWEGPGILWILGPNGSGKSTLMKMMAGLKRPSRGTIRWRDQDVDVDVDGLQGKRALAAPEIQPYAELTLLENLRFVAEMNGLQDPQQRAEQVLEEIGLTSRAGERPEELSSGLRQRLRLGLAWVHEPSLLLLDEPSSNLDESSRRWLWQRVRARAGHALCIVATNVHEEVGGGEATIDLTRVARN